MRRVVLILAGVVLLGGLFLLLRPLRETPDGSTSPSSPAPSPTGSPEVSPTPTAARPDALEIEVEVEDGEVKVEVEGTTIENRRVAVDQGDRIALEVQSDVADEVHVHGYDLTGDVGPGGRAEIRFRADVPGIFEVELEERGLLLLRLEVRTT